MTALRFLPEQVANVLRAGLFGFLLLAGVVAFIPMAFIALSPAEWWAEWKVAPQQHANRLGEPLIMVSTTRVRSQYGPLRWSMRAEYLDILRCNGGVFRSELHSSGAFGEGHDFNQPRSQAWPFKGEIPQRPMVCEMHHHITLLLPLGMTRSLFTISGPIEFQ